MTFHSLSFYYFQYIFNITNSEISFPCLFTETSGSPRKKKTVTRASASNKDDEAHRKAHNLDKDLNEKPQRKIYKSGLTKRAEFQHITDSSGENAYDLFLNHYKQQKLPPADTGFEALELFNKRYYKQNTGQHSPPDNIDFQQLPSGSAAAPHSYHDFLGVEDEVRSGGCRTGSGYQRYNF